MKDIRHLRCLGAVLLWCVGWGVAAEDGRASDVWTLERCEREALVRSHEVGVAAYRLQQAEASADEAEAVRRPTLSASGAYTYTSETMELGLPALGTFNLPTIRFGDGNVYDLGLVASVPLFTGGALRSRAQAERAASRAARHDLAADSLQVVHEVRTAYFRALGAKAQADAARVAEDRLRRHVTDLEAAIEIGAAAEEARIQALSRLRQGEQRRLQADLGASVETLNLGRLVGRPGEEPDLLDNLRRPLFLHEPFVRGDSVDGRPELAAFDERIQQSERLAGAARGAYFPTLSAQLSYHHAKPGVDLIADEWMQYAAAGIVLSWPIWDWGARAQRVRGARVAGRVLEEQRALLHDALRNNLAVALSALASAREQAAKVGERAELERRRLELVKGRYKNAAATESERLDAEDDLAAAEMDLAAATAHVRLAEADVLYALGQ